MRDNTTIVSFDDEPLMLVDPSDNVIGFEEKLNAHKGDGKLHRAFSIFLFNDLGEVLLQRRSELKPLWPGYWSNTCCSHPRRGETLEEATRRRLREELDLSAKLTFLFKFEYQAQFENVGSEHELCSVFVGHVDGRPMPPLTTPPRFRSANGWIVKRSIRGSTASSLAPRHGLQWSGNDYGKISSLNSNYLLELLKPTKPW